MVGDDRQIIKFKSSGWVRFIKSGGHDPTKLQVFVKHTRIDGTQSLTKHTILDAVIHKYVPHHPHASGVKQQDGEVVSGRVFDLAGDGLSSSVGTRREQQPE